MSTVVKIVMAVVLYIMNGGQAPEKVNAITQAHTIECCSELDKLNPHYIITRDEFLSHQNQ